ncbi:glycosyltransferase family 4 protein [Scytonema sp. NUACC21]
MRILIYSYNYHPEPIGIAPLMTELAEGLVKRGHSVRVITAMPNYPQRRIYPEYRGKLYNTEYKNGVKIQRSYVWIRPQPRLMERIFLEMSFASTSFLQALNGPKPDIILLTVPSLPISIPAALLGWLYSCPVILNLQDILPEAAVCTGLLKNKWLIRIFTTLEKFAYRTATKITVIADGFVENLLGKGVPANKIVLLSNWADITFIRPLPKENNRFRITHHLAGKFVVLYSGNIALTQGLETVVKAAKTLQHIPDIIVVIVGDSFGLQQLQQYTLQSKVSNVLLLPFVKREHLPEMLAAADVGLVVQKRNVISFNMPSKIQVLLACGRAILGSVPLKGTAAFTLQKSGSGIVVPPEDPDALAAAILDLYKHPDKVETLGRKSRQYAVEQYALEQALNQYETLFYQVTADPVFVPTRST